MKLAELEGRQKEEIDDFHTANERDQTVMNAGFVKQLQTLRTHYAQVSRTLSHTMLTIRTRMLRAE